MTVVFYDLFSMYSFSLFYFYKNTVLKLQVQNLARPRRARVVGPRRAKGAPKLVITQLISRALAGRREGGGR